MSTTSLLQFPSGAVYEMADDFSRYGFSEESKDFRATKVVDSVRWKELEHHQRYFECKQHDWKTYDFDGRQVQKNVYGAPLLSASKVPWYVPLKMRRPSVPYRVGKRIISSFTTMVFGESRWPDINVLQDEEGQAFINALVEETSLATKMIQARNIGGAVGTVALSWCYYQGQPSVEVHNGKCLYVHEWEDKSNQVPAHVTEIYKYEKDQWDPSKKAIVREWYWHRQDWTKIADVAFHDVKCKSGEEPLWQVDEENTVVHNDGFAHFVYIQNLPPIEGIDGVSDCDGTWDQMDAIDILVSVLARGGILNLDPTLKLKMDPEIVDHAFIRKGSDNALVTGETGDASYMELAGTSITAGLSLMGTLRQQVLETCECVIPDPDKIAAAGTSSVALKMIYAPMLGKCDILRDNYGKAVRELLRQMLVVAQRLYEGSVQPRKVDEGTEEDVLVTGFVKLPPRVVTEDVLDEEGNPTGEQLIHMEPQSPGASQVVTLSWGPYFTTTSTDQTAVAASLVQATGGKAFCSRKTATELFASVVSRDPVAMWAELEAESNKDAAQQQTMMDSMGTEPGGPVDPMAHDGLEGSEEQEDEESEGPESEGDPDTATRVAADSLTEGDYADVIRVNEARNLRGLGPLLLPNGEPDPDGELMLSVYRAKHGL
jgi:hypothetical protein